MQYLKVWPLEGRDNNGGDGSSGKEGGGGTAGVTLADVHKTEQLPISNAPVEPQGELRRRNRWVSSEK